MENKGVIFSAVGHFGVILWIVLGDIMFGPDDVPPMTVTNVSLMTSAQFEAMAAAALQWPLGGLWQVLVVNALNAVIGIVAGAVVLAGVLLVQRLRGTSAAH